MRLWLRIRFEFLWHETPCKAVKRPLRREKTANTSDFRLFVQVKLSIMMKLSKNTLIFKPRPVKNVYIVGPNCLNEMD